MDRRGNKVKGENAYDEIRHKACIFESADWAGSAAGLLSGLSSPPLEQETNSIATKSNANTIEIVFFIFSSIFSLAPIEYGYYTIVSRDSKLNFQAKKLPFLNLFIKEAPILPQRFMIFLQSRQKIAAESAASFANFTLTMRLEHRKKALRNLRRASLILLTFNYASSSCNSFRISRVSSSFSMVSLSTIAEPLSMNSGTSSPRAAL